MYIYYNKVFAYTHRWMAPESIRTRRFSHKSDVYAFGILLWEIWSGGSFPFMFISDDADVARRYRDAECTCVCLCVRVCAFHLR